MLHRLNELFPIRYTFFGLCVLGLLASLFGLLAFGVGAGSSLVLLALVVLGVYDVLQSRRSILRNYPIIGHLRFMLEFVRPEIRQYFLESDNEASPFSRAQRSLVYQRAKGDSDKRPFGTQLDVHAEGYEWINHSMTPSQIDTHDFRIWIGGTPEQVAAQSASAGLCTQPYNASIFNISAMSFGALSANAILSLNAGAAKGRFAHDTGEGSISEHHRRHGGDLIWEIGSGYFGCRNDDGSFNADRFTANACDPQVKMIEIKLSQGAKPGHGGILPASKITEEIAQTRGVPMGQDCVSPARHSAFSTPNEMMAFIAELRQLSGGKPVGFKLCIGQPWEFMGMVKAMMDTGILPDFVVVDGAEGGTGASPLEFSDHLGMPMREGLLFVHNTLVGTGLRDRIRIGAAGKIVSAFDIAATRALGADWVNAARGFMFALGCIQSLSCNTNRCPVGVATQDPLLQRALVVPEKAERVFNFHRNTLHALAEMLAAAGLDHPSQIGPHHLVRRVSQTEVRLFSQLHTFLAERELLSGSCHSSFYKNVWDIARADSFELL